MKKLVRPSVSDPVNSVDLFDAERTNTRGRRFCVAVAILPEQVEEYWEQYIKFGGAIRDIFPDLKSEKPIPVANLKEILENWKKVIEQPAQEGAEAGVQHGLKKAYDDIMQAAEWEEEL